MSMIKKEANILSSKRETDIDVLNLFYTC